MLLLIFDFGLFISSYFLDTLGRRRRYMEKNDIIRGYRGIINWNELNEKIKAIIFVKMKCNNFKDVETDIIALKVHGVTILEAQRLAGEWCMMIKVRVSEPQDITRLIDEMVKIPEVQETTTTFILTTLLEDGLKEKEYNRAERGNNHETPSD